MKFKVNCTRAILVFAILTFLTLTAACGLFPPPPLDSVTGIYILPPNFIGNFLGLHHDHNSHNSSFGPGHTYLDIDIPYFTAPSSFGSPTLRNRVTSFNILNNFIPNFANWHSDDYFAWDGRQYIPIVDFYFVFIAPGLHWPLILQRNHKRSTFQNSEPLELGVMNYIRFTLNLDASSSQRLTFNIEHGTGTFADGTTFTTRPQAIGNLIAVGDGGSMAHSSDGINWTPMNVGTRNWRSVTYGNGRYVAVGDDGSMAHSSDGINWTQINVGPAHWRGITFANGRFVAVGAVAAIAHSSDGINWTQINMGADVWISVKHINGRFIAVGNEGAIGHSTNGINWTLQSVGTVTWWDLTHANGRYVIVGSGGNMAHSTNGFNWTQINVGSTGFGWTGITYGNGRFVAVGNYSALAHSTNGINWIPLTLGVGIWRSVAYYDGRFVAVGNSGAMAHSSNGINWTQTNVGTADWWYVTTRN